MTLLRVRRLARQDIDLAFTWYAERDNEAAAKFLLELELMFVRLQTSHEQFPEVYRNVRRALLKTFPYAIYFRSLPSSIVVLAVAHQKRAPAVWKQRV
jgi:plasmid stabilization system protein ParE